VKAFRHRPQSVFLRRALFQVHLWVGVLAGLYVFVVCITGAALVFRIDMQRALHPELFTPVMEGPLVHPADVLESVVQAYPGGQVSGVDAPTTARPTYLAYVLQDDRFLTILVDPVSARMLGELPDRSFVRTLQDLHFDLLAGRTGRLVNGAGAFLLLFLCATGLVIWWPGVGQWRRGFTVDFSRSWKRVNWDLHSATGIWTVSIIAMWAITGIYFAFPSQFRAAVNAVSPLTVTRAPLSDPAGAERGAAPTWRALIAQAEAHVPDRFVARVVVPSNEQAAFHVLFSDVRPTPVGTSALSSVYLDRFTGALLQESPTGPRTAGDVVMAWVGPLHVGSFGGIGVKVAWLVLGLAPPLLFVTGFLMWWTRVVRVRWLRTQSSPAIDLSRVAG
jgi:uncharacterized iron-regulated membrane protein